MSEPGAGGAPSAPAGGVQRPGPTDPASTRREALRLATALLGEAGVEPAAMEARFLVLGVLGLAPRDLVLDGDRPVGPGADALAAALARRLAGEPTARILGSWEFWGLPMRLSPETLVPRPDTETLVEAALALHPERGRACRILDLGTGTGCILTALLRELPLATGLGLDRSEGALRTARANAGANGVGARARFAAGDWCAALTGSFDLVVSNPPYIATAAIPGLAREVRAHDPAAALDGGGDGLAAYRAILAGLRAGNILAPGGHLVLEVGHDQAGAVSALGERAGYRLRAVSRDLAGHERVLAFDAPAS